MEFSRPLQGIWYGYLTITFCFLHNWFENYLHQRTQDVKITSNRETIVCGIPQVSTLGPLLFLIYVNDLPKSSSRLSYLYHHQISFADDTNLSSSGSCLNELESVVNNELTLALRNCTSNKLLSVNSKKTNYSYMIISSARKIVCININNIGRKSFDKYFNRCLHIRWTPEWGTSDSACK